MPKVSIIVPVYNKADYLETLFEALSSQKYEDWELIFINDGSVDGSCEKLHRFESTDVRVRVIDTENGGVSKARNTGLSEASGEWIWFVDADDLPDGEFLNNVFSGGEIKADIVAGSFTKLNKNGETEFCGTDEKGGVFPDEFPELFMKYQGRNGFWGYLWNKLIKRRFIKENSLRFKEGLTLAEDLKFMVSAYKTARVELTRAHAMRYTVGAVNSSYEKKIDYMAQLEIRKDIYNWIVNERGKVKYREELACQMSSFAAFAVFYSFENGDDYLGAANLIYNDRMVFENLTYKNSGGTMTPVIKGLMKKSDAELKLYLNIRRVLRSFYRRLKKLASGEAFDGGQCNV